MGILSPRSRKKASAKAAEIPADQGSIRFVTIPLPVGGGMTFKWSVDGVERTFTAPEGMSEGQEQEFSFDTAEEPAVAEQSEQPLEPPTVVLPSTEGNSVPTEGSPKVTLEVAGEIAATISDGAAEGLPSDPAPAPAEKGEEGGVVANARKSFETGGTQVTEKESALDRARRNSQEKDAAKEAKRVAEAEAEAARLVAEEKARRESEAEAIRKKKESLQKQQEEAQRLKNEQKAAIERAKKEVEQKTHQRVAIEKIARSKTNQRAKVSGLACNHSDSRLWNSHSLTHSLTRHAQSCRRTHLNSTRWHDWKTNLRAS